MALHLLLHASTLSVPNYRLGTSDCRDEGGPIRSMAACREAATVLNLFPYTPTLDNANPNPALDPPYCYCEGSSESSCTVKFNPGGTNTGSCGYNSGGNTTSNIDFCLCFPGPAFGAGFLVVLFLIFAFGSIGLCYKHFQDEAQSPLRKFADHLGWFDAAHAKAQESSSSSAAAVAPMPTMQEYISVRLQNIVSGDPAEVRSALEDLDRLEGTWTESHCFDAANGPREMLEQLRICAPADRPLFEKILTNLASEEALRKATRGDEAAHDAALLERLQTMTCVFTTMFTVILVGVFIFGAFAFLNGNIHNTHDGNRHSWHGMRFFLWMTLILSLFAILTAYPSRFIFAVYFSALSARLGEHDKQVEKLLADGSVRLLDVAWLKHTKLKVLPRRQDLPEDAFVAPERAVRLYSSRRRCVGVLSYRWLRPEHPDPCGQRLEAIQRLLSMTSFHIDALFWDWASIPQKGLSADGTPIERTDAERAAFSAALSVMGNLYASLQCTMVLQLKEIPQQPKGWKGAGPFNMRPYEASGWCNFEEGAARLVVGHMSLFKRLAARGEVFRRAMEEALLRMFGVLLAVGLCCWSTCECCARACVDNKGKGHQVPEHVKAKRQERMQYRGTLYFRYVLRDAAPKTVEKRRSEARALLNDLRNDKVRDAAFYFAPKLVDISDPDYPEIESVLQPPSLAELREKIEKATFTGKGDIDKVTELLENFDSMMKGQKTSEQKEKSLVEWVKRKVSRAMGKAVNGILWLRQRAVTIVIKKKETTRKDSLRSGSRSRSTLAMSMYGVDTVAVEPVDEKQKAGPGA